MANAAGLFEMRFRRPIAHLNKGLTEAMGSFRSLFWPVSYLPKLYRNGHRQFFGERTKARLLHVRNRGYSDYGESDRSVLCVERCLAIDASPPPSRTAERHGDAHLQYCRSQPAFASLGKAAGRTRYPSLWLGPIPIAAPRFSAACREAHRVGSPQKKPITVTPSADPVDYALNARWNEARGGRSRETGFR